MEPEPPEEPASPGAVVALDLERIWAKNLARRLVESERVDVAEGARKHASNPSAWRRFVASYYGRRVPVVGALCDQDAAKTYCAARREMILDAGVGVLEQREQAEAALMALAARGKAW